MNSNVSRPTVLFHVPADLRCYGDWDFQVFPGTFALYSDVLIADLTQLIRDDRFHIMRLLFPGWRQDYRERVRLRRLLSNDGRATATAIQEFQGTIWCIILERIYSRNFLYYICPACNRRYSPEEGAVHDWEYGESLFAHGGRRFECPRGHTVYSIMDWNS